MTWGTGLWGTFLWGAPSFLISASPGKISKLGGELITLTGAFDVDVPLEVHLGPLGTVSDPLCYGGQGLGYEALSLDGQTVIVASPPLETGDVIATVVQGAESGTIAGITVIERSWPGKLHRMRRSFAPWVETGKRMLEPEEL